MLREVLLYVLVWMGFVSALWCYTCYLEWRYGEEAVTRERAPSAVEHRGAGAICGAGGNVPPRACGRPASCAERARRWSDQRRNVRQVRIFTALLGSRSGNSSNTPRPILTIASTCCAGTALRRVHAALAGVPENLPRFWTKIDDCRRLVDDRAALPGLAADDRLFLSRCTIACARRLARGRCRAWRSMATLARTMGSSPQRARSTAISRTSALGRAKGTSAISAMSISRRLSRSTALCFWLLSDLRSVCVAVWCFQQYAWPEKREAAEYHLGYLKAKSASLSR
jgi:hypothetical protein